MSSKSCKRNKVIKGTVDPNTIDLSYAVGGGMIKIREADCSQKKN
jgi:hypothetical protein